jgi:hypothetical protein
MDKVQSFINAVDAVLRSGTEQAHKLESCLLTS